MTPPHRFPDDPDDNRPGQPHLPGNDAPPPPYGHQPPPQGWNPGPPQPPYGPQGYGHPQAPGPTYGAGYGPGGYPPPPKKSGAKTALIVIGAIVGFCLVVGIIGNALGGGTDTDTAAAPEDTAVQQPAAGEPTKQAEKKPEKKVPGLNTPVRDGKFEFTVKSVQCGKTEVGSEYLNKQAQGQYCLVTLTIKNIGDKAQLFDSSSQQAYNAGGQEYKADGAAGIYANPNGETFLNEINPGNSVSGVLPFDIPKGQKLAKLELHDSPFSGGVEVSVS